MVRAALCFSLRLLIMKRYFFLFLLFLPHRPILQPAILHCFSHYFVFFSSSFFLLLLNTYFLPHFPRPFSFLFFFRSARGRKKRSKKKKTTKIAICACMCFLSDSDRGRKNRGREKTGAAQILALFVVCLLALIHGRSSALLLSFCCFFSFLK